MRRLSVFWSVALVAALLFAVAGCGKSDEKSGGPAERAGATMGRAIDQTVEKARPAVERAGEALKEAGGKAKEEVSQAFEKLKEGAKSVGEKTSDEKQ